MKYRIEIISQKKLIGKHTIMSVAANKTVELWKSFMPRRNEIGNKVNSDFISMQVFPSGFNFFQFNVHAPFEKWAAVEVTDFNTVPVEMESFVLPSGMYAVFQYKGDMSKAASAFQYIFTGWLPNSGFVLDDRPHFELLGANYKNNDPDSEEEIWIPVRKNNS